MTIIFFGSFQNYSVQVLEALHKHFLISAVVTAPPKPAGRHLKLTPTAVQLYAEKHRLPVYPLDNLQTIPAAGRRAFLESATPVADRVQTGDGERGLAEASKKARRPQRLTKGLQSRPDFLVVAGYGKLIPPLWLNFPKIMAVNMHPSLLPHYRGAMPAEWAILRGEKETGVTLVKMSEEFDKGEILVQKALPVESHDTRETLYAKLYDLGARLLVETLPQIAKGKITPKPQPEGQYFYARRLTRKDGFVPWSEIKEALETGKNAQELERKFRAFYPWPGLWSEVEIKGKKQRLIILSARLTLPALRLTLETVQLEGKKPVSFSQFAKAYL